MKQWLKDAVFYEIYPQSFYDTNGDGIGDLQGIIAKLDYIKGLGCNALWINPCFDSPFKDAGYDVRDYKKIAQRYGTNEDAAALFKAAHEKGIRVLFDLVPGHTSEEHEWFKASCRPEKNEYSDRFIWTDSCFASGDGMPFIGGETERNGTYILNFFKCQPALNYGYGKINQKWQKPTDDPACVATVEAMKDVMRFWLKMGCDGFRVDMAGSLVKNDPEGKGTIRLWQNVREFLDQEFPHAAMVSEWGEPDKSLQGGFHMDFLLHFGPSHYNDLFRCEEPFFSSRGKGDVAAFVEKYIENYEKSEKKGLICIPSGNHDMDRLARGLHGDELKVAFAFLLSMPGAPFIYYGDEIGMRYVEGLTSVEGGYSRTGSRSPMQWDDGVNAGFSTASAQKLYIQQDSSADRPTVEKQTEDKDSLYHEIRKLIAVRKAHEALLNKGEINFVYAKHGTYPLAYVRSSGQEKILVVINPSDQKVQFPYEDKLGEVLYQFGGAVESDGKVVSVQPQSVAFIRL